MAFVWLTTAIDIQFTVLYLLPLSWGDFSLGRLTTAIDIQLSNQINKDSNKLSEVVIHYIRMQLTVSILVCL